MKNVNALALIGYGINCDWETEAAFRLAGAEVRRVHINELIFRQESLANYQILALPGGFSYGDDIASGKVLSNKIKTYLGDDLQGFIESGKLVIGICNGFQVMVKSGLLPGFDRDYRTQRTTLTFNDSGKFEDRWVNLRAEDDKCIFTRGIKRLSLPVAHGEGKFFAQDDVLKKLEDRGQIVFKYAHPNGQGANGKFPYNPNGSLGDIAGICDSTGRIFGMMPHPERYLCFTNHPNWTRKRERLKRQGARIPEYGDGLKIFKNAVQYVKDNF